MLKSKKIFTEDGKGFYRVFNDYEIERVNPLVYFPETEIRKRAVLERDLANIAMPEIVAEQDKIDNLFFERRAAKEFKIEFNLALERELPTFLHELLDSNSKKEQIKILKGQEVNTDMLFTLILRAYRDFDYTFSRYQSERKPKGIDSDKLPIIFEVEADDKINVIGDTKYSKGQLKQVIEQRKVIIANFFDKGDTWHCIFLTHRSLAGKEKWNKGQPHFHYISNKWNLKREEVVKAIKRGEYLSTSVHIGIKDYKKMIKSP